MTASRAKLQSVIQQVLCGGDHFLAGVHLSSDNASHLLQAVVEWTQVLHRNLEDVIAAIEPCVRQSILVSLLPAKALDAAYQGSIDAAIDEHLFALGLVLSADEKRVIRDVCINLRKFSGLTARAARNSTFGLAQVKAQSSTYHAIRARQCDRCVWCGAGLNRTDIKETLEHVSPKHIGDDFSDGRNWALACASCNAGKSDTLAWAANAYAHDYVRRSDLLNIAAISREHRWAVLMRDKRCAYCSASPKKTELFIVRRVRTGLPVPANCAAACNSCVAAQTLELLAADYMPDESGRA